MEKIVGHKTEKGKDYWKVRWVGYGANDDTWEPRENFLDEKVVKMLNEFEVDRLAKKEKKAIRKVKSIYNDTKLSEPLKFLVILCFVPPFFGSKFIFTKLR